MLEQKDYAVIVLVIAISFVASFFLASLLINTPEDRAETVLDVSRFSEDTPSVDRQIFHERAVNPTEEISIGDSSTDNPFDGSDN